MNLGERGREEREKEREGGREGEGKENNERENHTTAIRLAAPYIVSQGFDPTGESGGIRLESST